MGNGEITPRLMTHNNHLILYHYSLRASIYRTCQLFTGLVYVNYDE